MLTFSVWIAYITMYSKKSSVKNNWNDSDGDQGLSIQWGQ